MEHVLLLPATIKLYNYGKRTQATIFIPTVAIIIGQRLSPGLLMGPVSPPVVMIRPCKSGKPTRGCVKRPEEESCITCAVAGGTGDYSFYRTYCTRRPGSSGESVDTPCRNGDIRTNSELGGVHGAGVRGGRSPRAGDGAVLPGHSL